MKMARTTDYKTLIDAVQRYINTVDYPRVEVICAILGITRDAEKSEDDV